jgi:hypothetical protein
MSLRENFGLAREPAGVSVALAAFANATEKDLSSAAYTAPALDLTMILNRCKLAEVEEARRE